MKRLADTALENLDAWLAARSRGAVSVEVRAALRNMLTELRARRAADLTDADIKALRWIRGQVNVIRFERSAMGASDEHTPAALAVLDKLLASGGGK